MARPVLRHVLGPAEALQVRNLLERWNETLDAVAEGRVFLNRRRVERLTQRLSAGDVLEVFAPARAPGAITLVDQRHDVVVIEKPSGIPAEPDEHGTGTSAREQVEALLGRRVHAASRLDVGVSGLMTLTLSSRAQRHLLAQRARGTLERTYLALVGSPPVPSSGAWTEPILRGQRQKPAETRYRVAVTLEGGACLLRLRPLTGRRHQIRIHASNSGSPLLGDRRYGGARHWTLGDGQVVRFERVLLHAARLKFEDPTGALWDLSSPAPPDFIRHFQALGGVGTPD